MGDLIAKKRSQEIMMMKLQNYCCSLLPLVHSYCHAFIVIMYLIIFICLHNKPSSDNKHNNNNNNNNMYTLLLLCLCTYVQHGHRVIIIFAIIISIKKRLESNEGLNLTEFLYQVFQAFDWLHLFHKHGCNIQVIRYRL